jgi:hypothetical protein
MHNIVLTSQNITTPAGVEVHGIFPNFGAAAKHAAKDHNLPDDLRTGLYGVWEVEPRDRTEKREIVLRNDLNEEIYWCASVQPLRTEEGV